MNGGHDREGQRIQGVGVGGADWGRAEWRAGGGGGLVGYEVGADDDEAHRQCEKAHRGRLGISLHLAVP